MAVETMRQVIGGTVRRPVAGPAPRKIGGPGVANATLTRQAGNGTGTPACFQTSDYGHNTAASAISRAAAPGEARTRNHPRLELDVSAIRGCCKPWISGPAPVRHRRDYTVAAQYKATLPTHFDVYYRTEGGSWQYWATSPAFPASASWAKASWSTPAVPGRRDGGQLRAGCRLRRNDLHNRILGGASQELPDRTSCSGWPLRAPLRRPHHPGPDAVQALHQGAGGGARTRADGSRADGTDHVGRCGRAAVSRRRRRSRAGSADREIPAPGHPGA